MADGRLKRARRLGGGRLSVSIRDVAKTAGVSVATVSRALSADADKFSVRAETRQRVLEISEQLGYRPNDLARALLHQRTSVIGLVVPDISNPYYAGVVRGVEDIAAASGYRVVLCNTDRDADKLTRYVDTLVKSRVDGLIIAGGATDSSIDPRAFHQYRTRAVLVGRHELAYPSVQIDNVAAAEEVTTHALDLGHTRVAFVAGPFGSHTVQDRLAGYRKALEANSIGYDHKLVEEGELNEESGYRSTLSLLGRRKRPTAMICVNDRIAVGALAALTDYHLPVPEQMTVMGFDDVSISSYLRPRLTTVSIPTYEIGSSAAALLLEQLRTGSDDVEAGVVMLPTRLVVRDSCAPPPEEPVSARLARE